MLILDLVKVNKPWIVDRDVRVGSSFNWAPKKASELFELTPLNLTSHYSQSQLTTKIRPNGNSTELGPIELS